MKALATKFVFQTYDEAQDFVIKRCLPRGDFANILWEGERQAVVTVITKVFGKIECEKSFIHKGYDGNKIQGFLFERSK